MFTAPYVERCRLCNARSGGERHLGVGGVLLYKRSRDSRRRCLIAFAAVGFLAGGLGSIVREVLVGCRRGFEGIGFGILRSCLLDCLNVSVVLGDQVHYSRVSWASV